MDYPDKIRYFFIVIGYSLMAIVYFGRVFFYKSPLTLIFLVALMMSVFYIPNQVRRQLIDEGLLEDKTIQKLFERSLKRKRKLK